MTTELGNLSSVSGASVQLSDKSGQVAAQLLSGVMEEAKAVQQDSKDTNGLERSGQRIQADIEKQVQSLHEFAQLQGWTVNFSVEKSWNRW